MVKSALFAASLFGCSLLIAQPPAPPPHEKGHHPGGPMERCAKVCADCMTACEACNHHCLVMLADGKKDHQTTAAMTADCAGICAVAAQSAARMGPFSKEICEACAKACERCGAECDKFPAPEMKHCARACRECAAACREMTGGHARHAK